MKNLVQKIAPYWKTLIGFVAPGVAVIGVAVTAGSDGGSTITQSEFVTALVAMLLTSAGVYAKANKDPQGEHQDESVQPPAQPEDTESDTVPGTVSGPAPEQVSGNTGSPMWGDHLRNSSS